jgi:hypothetical protein
MVIRGEKTLQRFWNRKHFSKMVRRCVNRLSGSVSCSFYFSVFLAASICVGFQHQACRTSNEHWEVRGLVCAV